MKRFLPIFSDTLNDFVVFFKPNSRAGIIRFGVLLGALLIGGVALLSQGGDVQEQAETSRGVQVASVAELSDGGALSIAGSARAIDRATIQAEVGGRITDVRVGLGERVAAGQIIATIENSAQYASLLQAEGSYEAALASAAQSDVSARGATDTALDTARGAYATVSGIVFNTIDDVFSNPRASTPGLRIDAATGGMASFLNTERVVYNTLLSDWQQEITNLTETSDLDATLRTARQHVTRTQTLVDAFITTLARQDASGVFSESEIAAMQSEFTTAKQSLNSTLRSIDSAREELASARISGTGGDVSSADANVKQALGSLRAAQAAYEKTILRSPINGEVQALHVRTGDYVSAQTLAASVANANAIEITTYVSERERSRISVGDTVTLDENAEGTVTAVAPGVDSVTGKVEVRIQTDDTSVQNGDTIRVTFAGGYVTDTNSDAPITIPVSALKVGTDRIVVFTVDTDGTLVEHTVAEGPLLGSSIVIVDGLSRDMRIVTDARGLNAGDTVTILE